MISILLSLVLASFQGEYQFPEERLANWEVIDFFPGSVNSSTARIGIIPLGGLGSPARNGRVATILESSLAEHSGANWSRSYLLDPRLDLAGMALPTGYHERFQTRLTWNSWMAAVLRRADSGFELCIADVQSENYVGLDLSSGAFRGTFENLDPGNGIPDAGLHDSIWWAGDVTGDGWDDLYFTSSSRSGSSRWRHYGLLDGESRAIIWSRTFDRGGNHQQVTFHGASEPPDLNGDGIADLVGCFDVFQGSRWDNTLVALSGTDGALLWEVVQNLPIGVGGCTVCPDINGDAIADFIVGVYLSSKNSPVLQVHSGVDGSVIRSNGIDELVSQIGGRFELMPGIDSARMWAEQSTAVDGAVDIFVSVRVIEAGVIRFAILQIDGESGNVVGVNRGPLSLAPWHSQPNADTYSEVYTPLGDIDGDGLIEIGRMCWLPSDPQFGLARTFGYSILSRQTLWASPAVNAGMGLSVSANVPSGAGCTVRIVGSLGFELSRGDGWIVDGWNSHLCEDALLMESVVHPGSSGALDSRGRWSGNLALPARLASLGREVWLRGVILEAGGKVKTMTNLRSVRIEP